MDTKKYHQEVRSRVCEKIKMRLGTLKTAMILLVPLVIANGIAYIIFLRWWDLDTANQNIIAPLLISALVEVLVLVGLITNWRYSEVPAEMYIEQKNKADLYTIKGIELTPILSNDVDNTPSGVIVVNKKGIKIRGHAVLTKVWQSRKETSVNKALGWFVDSKSRFLYEDIEDSLLLTLENIYLPTGREPIELTAPLPDGSFPDFGKRIKLELADGFYYVYEKLPMKIDVLFNFIINGTYIKHSHEFNLFVIDGKLKVEKIGTFKPAT